MVDANHAMPERPKPPDKRGVPCGSWIEWCIAELNRIQQRLGAQPTDAAHAYACAELEELRAKAEQIDLCHAAADALVERKGEDVEAWADQLAKDVCNATD